jgi:hypothetical protein
MPCLLIVRKVMQHGLAAGGTSAGDWAQAAVPAAAKRCLVSLSDQGSTDLGSPFANAGGTMPASPGQPLRGPLLSQEVDYAEDVRSMPRVALNVDFR